MNNDERLALIEARITDLDNDRTQLRRLLELVAALLADEALRSRADEATAVR